MTLNSSYIGNLVNDGFADIQTGPFGTQLKASEYTDKGTPVINVRNIGYGGLRPEKLEYLPDFKCDQLSDHVIFENDIVFGRKGAVDRHLFVQEDQVGWIQGSDCIRLRFLSGSIHPRFISYQLLLEKHKSWILTQCSNKSTMASMNQDVIKRIPIWLPAFDIQKRIADVLSNYDRLIDNNNRRIALLEEAVHRLYREWFVHLRFPGHERVAVVDGVPEGWENSFLSRYAKVNSKSITQRTAPDFLNYIDISSVTTGRISQSFNLRFSEAPSRARRVVDSGDIIWSMVRPGKRAYALVLEPVENMIVSTGFAVITAIHIPFSFLYALTTTDLFVEHMELVATGAAYPAVKPKDFENMEILVPPKNLLNQFDDFAQPIHRQIHKLLVQSQQLREARDRLLPRLMNGSIPV